MRRLTVLRPIQGNSSVMRIEASVAKGKPRVSPGVTQTSLRHGPATDISPDGHTKTVGVDVPNGVTIGTRQLAGHPCIVREET